MTKQFITVKNTNDLLNILDSNGGTLEHAPLTKRGAIMPLSIKPKTKKPLALSLALDWLQYTGTTLENFETFTHSKYQLKKLDRGSMNWTNVFEIYTTIGTKKGAPKQRIAILETKNRIPSISPDLVCVKIENKFLYQDIYLIYNTILNLNKALNITFKNYTRIDSAFDFNHINYSGGVTKFLHHFASGKLRVKNKQTQIQKDKAGNITGITWGTYNSECRVNCYNKTEEQKQKKHKPYIFEYWKKQGLNIKETVFRLEFSHKKSIYDILEISEDGEVINNLGSHADITLILKLKDYANYLYYRFFQVANIEVRDKRFSRLKKINIFDFDRLNLHHVRLSDKQVSSNYTKAQIKVIVQDINQLRENNEKLLSYNLNNYLSELLNRHALQNWFSKKYSDFIFDKEAPNIFYHQHNNDIIIGRQFEINKNAMSLSHSNRVWSEKFYNNTIAQPIETAFEKHLNNLSKVF